MTPTAIAVSGKSPGRDVISPWMTFLLAAACGVIAANIYYAQPLVGPISHELGLSPKAAGLIVTMTQIGYGTGLLLIVPLGDLIENRRLILCVMSVAVLALLGAAFSTTPLQFLVAALFIGLGSVAIQIIVPFAAHLTPEATRGQVVGQVMSGLMVGIMMARPISSFITSISSWHVVFIVSTLAMVLLAIVLGRALPKRVPVSGLGYGALLSSMAHLVVTTPILRLTATVSLVTSWPATQAWPPVGATSVVSMPIVVDLPAPLGPSRPKNSPWGTLRSMPRTASTLPLLDL